jgi:hypothetical protein
MNIGNPRFLSSIDDMSMPSFFVKNTQILYVFLAKSSIASYERHIRMAIGRDYADVPPTRGVHGGNSSERLEVAVTVNNADGMNRTPTPARLTWASVVRQQTPQALLQQQQQQQQ